MKLGGKSPHIILADAETNEAVQAAFWGIFWNKGKVCVAGSLLLVERSLHAFHAWGNVNVLSKTPRQMEQSQIVFDNAACRACVDQTLHFREQEFLLLRLH